MNCTFFGHADTPQEVESKLKETIVKLIEQNNVGTFYVGTHGNFDAMVYRILKGLENKYCIKYFVVLPCMPTSRSKYESYTNTIVPEGIENVPPRFGINYRNRWMIEQCDYVVTYVTRDFGGAVKFKDYAEKQKKTIINIKNAL